jgi:parallel beta-helix repeat protein
MTRGLAAGLTAAVCLCVGGVASGVAEAAPVTFAFTGAVTQTMFDPNDPSGGEITFGTGFSGSYTFESTAADRISSPSSGSYASPAGAPYGFAVNFGPGHDFVTSDALTVGVTNNVGGVDAYGALACFGGFSCPDVTLGLFLEDFDSSVFAGDALPLDTLMFEAFEVATFTLRGLIDGNQVEIIGNLDSLSCIDGCESPQPVPEPGTLLLLSPALAAIGWRRRGRAALEAMKAMKAVKAPVSAGVLAIILSGFATNAYAVDGIVLIDQTRALAGNVTPGDGPGFPVTISRPGSYRLSSNLDVPADAAGIVIFASGVTIDLNGFQLKGSGAGTGISALQARQAITVRNGSVTNFDKGIDVKGLASDVRDITAFGNQLVGLEIGAGATVSGNRAFNNNIGIRVQLSSIVTGNVVQSNGGFGLRVAEGSVIQGNTAFQNGIGMEIGCPSALLGNTSQNNSEVDISFLNEDCTRANNNIPLP